MIKTKIWKVSPFWLIGIVFVGITQTSASLLFHPVISPIKKEAQSPKPEVLGASTDIRGLAPTSTIISSASQSLDTSEIKAKSFVVFNLDTGEELLASNPNVKLGIASLTKLMTAWVTYQNNDLNQNFTVTNNDKTTIAPILNLALGDEVKALDVFNAMLIGSCNDAAKALANYTALITGKNFVALMNGQAKALGMPNTHFSNPVGFDSQYNYSTAEDLKILITQTQKLAAFKQLGRKTSYEFSGSLGNLYQTTATNKLLDDHPDIEAIKTGFTPSSLGAMATKVKLGTSEIVILVLDSKDREGDTLKLKDLVLNNFKLGQ